MKVFALRLKPDQDLKASLKAFVAAKNIQAGFILSAIGSLKRAAIRLANQNTRTVFLGNFEITSLAGTLSPGGVHLHIAIADSRGEMFGGHLEAGCLVYTTAEIVIGEATYLQFSREVDVQTGAKELVIGSKPVREPLLPDVVRKQRAIDCSD